MRNVLEVWTLYVRVEQLLKFSTRMMIKSAE